MIRRDAVWVVLIVMMTLTAYLPSLRGDFLWDDDAYVTKNKTLRDADGLRRIWFELGAVPQYYPLVHTTFWLEYHLWGLRPLGYHLTNVLLHAVNAVLLWFLLRRLSVPGSWAAAALFALHPVHVESVAWITERKNVLSGAFYFSSVLAYLGFCLPDDRPQKGRGPSMGKGRRRAYALTMGLYLGALWSKTVTATLPMALLLVTWWKRGRIDRWDVLRSVPLVAMGAVFGFITAWMERDHVGARGSLWDLSIVERCLVAGRALWFYAGKLVWPHPLTFIYPRWEVDATVWWQYLYPLAALTAIAVLWAVRDRIGKGPLVAILLFAGTLAPALGFFNVFPHVFSYVADHFQYLASTGLIALFAAVCARALQRLGPWAERARSCGCVGVLAVLWTLTWRQGHVYADVETLWRDTLAKNPNAFLAHNNLGLILMSRDKPDEAMVHFKEALRSFPHLAPGHFNLGLLLMRQDKPDEAMVHLEEVLRSLPDSGAGRTRRDEAPGPWGSLDKSYADYLADAACNLGAVLDRKGRLDEAMVYYARAVRLSPHHADAHYNLGQGLDRQGRLDPAISHYTEALRFDPRHAKAHNNLGLALVRRGRVQEGIVHCREASALEPNWPEPLNNLAWLLATHHEPSVRDGGRAISLANRACELTRYERPDVLDTLAAAYAEAGRFSEARAWASKAIDLAIRSGQEALASQIRARLKLYESSKAFHEPP